MPIYPQEINDWLQSQTPSDQQISAKEVKFQGVELNEGGELVNIPVVYGLRRVVGPRVFTSVKSDNSNILYTAIALSEGPITGISKLLIDDSVVLTDPTPFTTGTLITVGSGTYGGVLSVEFRQGTTGQSASSLLTEVTGRALDMAQFTASMDGIAYVVLKMTYSTTGPYKEFPKITVDVQGRKLRSSASYPFASASNVLENANPADVLLDLMTNTRYGRGIADAKINAASISSLRSSFATTLTPYINGQAIARGQVNWIMNTANSVLENVNELCRQFNIVLTLSNGQYRFVPEYSASSTSLTVNKSNLIGGYSETIPDLSVKYNRVVGTYNNGLNDWVDSQETYEDTALQTSDGKLLDVNIQFSAITNPYLVRFQIETIFRKSRGQRTITFSIDKSALELTVGDLILWDPASTGSSSSALRIIEMTLNDDFTFAVRAVTHSNTFYPPFTLGDIWSKPPVVPALPGPIIDPIIRPSLPTAGTINLGGTTLTGTRGTDFYTAPWAIIAGNLTAFDNANYQLSTTESYSKNSTANNYGTGVRVYLQTAGTVKWYYYSYTPFITFRLRDLGNATLGGEGIIVSGGSVYTRVYYVYEIDTATGAKFGWHSKNSSTTSEFNYFDPQTDTTVRLVRNGVTFSGKTILECLNPGASTMSGMPYLTYNSAGYYKTDDFAGMKGLFGSDPTGIAKPWVIPKTVWDSKQGFASTSASALMTVKYFVVTSTGTATFLASQTINLDRARAGDTGIQANIITQSRTYYTAATGATGALIPF